MSFSNAIETVDGDRWDLYAWVEVLDAGTRIRLTISDDEQEADRSTEICKVELPIEFAEEISDALAFAVRKATDGLEFEEDLNK
jgi:methyl coenzyme M reductase subunit D